MNALLEVKGLSTTFELESGPVRAVDGVHLLVRQGETLAIVGESGCGKSMTALSIMGLVPHPGRIVAGEILFAGRDLRKLREQEMRQIRGNKISMIFQEPMTSLNPVFRIGEQIAEGILSHQSVSKKEAMARAVDLLKIVGIPAAEDRIGEYPHRLSGGMRQRVMIAMALACNPMLLIADEPTTALDVTIQAQILELLDRITNERGMGVILITHDLGIVAERAASTAVMYAGKIVEYGNTASVLAEPLHPYTEGLLASLPQQAQPGQPIRTIPGSVPQMGSFVKGCGFCDRCPGKTWQCAEAPPPLLELSPGHLVRCWKYSGGVKPA